MADILPFDQKSKARKPQAVPKRSALCANGHHRWVIWQKQPFDSKRGKLVTVYRCDRCGAERTAAL